MALKEYSNLSKAYIGLKRNTSLLNGNKKAMILKTITRKGDVHKRKIEDKHYNCKSLSSLK